jgi:hypothetical protein
MTERVWRRAARAARGGVLLALALSRLGGWLVVADRASVDDHHRPTLRRTTSAEDPALRTTELNLQDEWVASDHLFGFLGVTPWRPMCFLLPSSHSVWR